MVMILVGLAAYTVLAGADFGAGFWTLLPGGPRADAVAIRDHARRAIGPVWEANHVWLVFVLVITWTAYPTAFGSIFSTLAIPLSLAAVGIILRGTAYALRDQADGSRAGPVIERVFALSSILTPFALGTVVGAIAAGRVPVGNAAGHLFTSWLAPVPIVVGVLTVAISAYLAAVYLAADARRLGERELETDFRLRALGMGAVAGVLAAVGLVVVHADAKYLWHGFTHGGGVRHRLRSGRSGDAAAGVAKQLRPRARVGGARGRCGHRGLGACAGAALPPRAHDPAGGSRSLHARVGRDRCRDRRGRPNPVARAALRAVPARAV
jgi:cytochrome d ubiquinol oxidase subunit II